MMTEIPWAGLAALIAMFVIPFLPAWLFDGPRTVKHQPMRHVCGECGAPWTSGHECEPEVEVVHELPTVSRRAPEVEAAPTPLRGELRRLKPRTELERRPERIAM
jgi:hypothetical protein